MVEPVADVEVLLEVVAERDVEERPPCGGQLHASRQASLHDGQIAGGEVSIRLVDEAVHLQAVMLRQ